MDKSLTSFFNTLKHFDRWQICFSLVSVCECVSECECESVCVCESASECVQCSEGVKASRGSTKNRKCAPSHTVSRRLAPSHAISGTSSSHMLQWFSVLYLCLCLIKSVSWERSEACVRLTRPRRVWCFSSRGEGKCVILWGESASLRAGYY